MKIIPPTDRPSRPGPSEWFTGTVRMDPLFAATDTTRAGGNHVTFEPGARTNWHTHPRGQTLIVTAGAGRACVEGGAVQTIRAGDIVRFEPNVRHWHGAAPDTAMSHIAIQEDGDDGPATAWTDDRVTDEQYGA